MGWKILSLFCSLVILAPAHASSTTTEDRKEAYRESILRTYDETNLYNNCACGESVTINENSVYDSCGQEEYGQPYQRTNAIDARNPGIAVFPFASRAIPNEETALDRLFCQITCKEVDTGDFSLTILLRAMFFGDDALQSRIVIHLQQLYDEGELRFWLTSMETQNLFTTENHMLMWISAAYLLKDKLSWRPDDDAFLGAEARLRHFLETKIQYGYYEWFSTNYIPFSLAPLLNVYDFGSDEAMKDLASQAIDVLLSEWLLFLNESGYMYPVAGRNFNHRYIPFFHANTWILKGTGVQLQEDSWRREPMGQFPATTTYDFETIAATWDPVVNKVFTIGHDQSEHRTVHKNISRGDRVAYQWSAGAFLVPRYVRDSLYFLGRYHTAITGSLPDILKALVNPLLRNLPGFVIETFLSIFTGQLYGTDCSGGFDVHLYKHHNIVLSSLRDYYPGYRAGQQFPIMTAVHDIAVYTQSGITRDCVSYETVSNSHLPKVLQDEHVALITYKPRWDVRLPFGLFGGWLTGFDLQVILNFPLGRFDETYESESWIMGRREDSYVAAWRDAHAEFHGCARAFSNGDNCDEYYYSPGSFYRRESAWVIVVGNNETHGSFDAFCNTVSQGTVRTGHSGAWLLGNLAPWSLFDVEVQVDGKTLQSSM